MSEDWKYVYDTDHGPNLLRYKDGTGWVVVAAIRSESEALDILNERTNLVARIQTLEQAIRKAHRLIPKSISYARKVLMDGLKEGGE